MRRFAALRRQADFLALRRRGRRVSTKHLTLYYTAAAPGDPRCMVGITVTKAIGKAVVRNKLRRRLAAIVNDAPASSRDLRLLIVPRPAAASLAFAALQAELRSALPSG